MINCFRCPIRRVPHEAPGDDGGQGRDNSGTVSLRTETEITELVSTVAQSWRGGDGLQLR